MVAELKRYVDAAAAHVSVGIAWWFEPGINFYIARDHLNWIKPVTREEPLLPYYFFYLPHDQRKAVEAAVGPLRVLRDFSLTETFLAQPVRP